MCKADEIEKVSETENEVIYKVKLGVDNEILCNVCRSKDSFYLKGFYDRKEPITVLKDNKFIKIYFKVPIMRCKCCNSTFTNNKGYFDKREISIKVLDLIENL